MRAVRAAEEARPPRPDGSAVKDRPAAPSDGGVAAEPTEPAGGVDRRVRRAQRAARPMLLEMSWETCHQVGGIYQVLRSKAPAMVAQWGEGYCLIGPYHAGAGAEFEEQRPPVAMRRAFDALPPGVTAHFGRWLITGRPRVILLEHALSGPDLAEAKYFLWADHGLELPADGLVDGVVGFARAAAGLVAAIADAYGPRPIVLHCHEWMGSLAILHLRRARARVGIVFTTHATRLGRQLAAVDDRFYEHLPFVDPAPEARRQGLAGIHAIERACAHGAHVLATVSRITGEECTHLLGRPPDVILPNGLNIRRFVAAHYLQSLHLENRHRIDDFTRAHFFPHYSFDLDRTLYFFSAGRFEPRNKGYDICLEAMARLDAQLVAGGLDVTVVFFVITHRPGALIRSAELRSRGLLQEIADTTQAITEQAGRRFFDEVTSGSVPTLDDLVDESWRLRLRRTVHAWRQGGMPELSTHDVPPDDPVLEHMRSLWLDNGPLRRVKVVYHPEFISPANPLWKMEYEQFVRGCHLGIFPSAYEPWGYTPLECIASGVPAVTSDLSGFGDYVLAHEPEHDRRGVRVVHRRGRTYHESAAELSQILLDFCHLGRRERIALRDRAEDFGSGFDWALLSSHYASAHRRALEAIQPAGA